jgi:hypothetical protein
MNTKVVDLSTSYNSYKGCMGFYSLDLNLFECQLVSLCLGTVKAGLQGVFHNFPLQICNAILHESCVPQQDLQLS